MTAAVLGDPPPGRSVLDAIQGRAIEPRRAPPGKRSEGVKRKITKEIVREIATQLREGRYVRDVAIAVGVSQNTVTHYAKCVFGGISRLRAMDARAFEQALGEWGRP